MKIIAKKIWQSNLCVLYCIYKIEKDENENPQLSASDGTWRPQRFQWKPKFPIKGFRWDLAHPTILAKKTFFNHYD